MYEIDLDNLTFEIRKSTPKYYRRAKICVEKGKARIIITDEEQWTYHHEGAKGIAAFMNHEFLHWILCSLIGYKYSGKPYDQFLEALGLYWQEVMMEIWV